MKYYLSGAEWLFKWNTIWVGLSDYLSEILSDFSPQNWIYKAMIHGWIFSWNRCHGTFVQIFAENKTYFIHLSLCERWSMVDKGNAFSPISNNLTLVDSP